MRQRLSFGEMVMDFAFRACWLDGRAPSLEAVWMTVALVLLGALYVVGLAVCVGGWVFTLHPPPGPRIPMPWWVLPCEALVILAWPVSLPVGIAVALVERRRFAARL